MKETKENNWQTGNATEDGIYLRAFDDTDEDSDAEVFHLIGGKWFKDGKPYVVYGGVWKKIDENQ